MWVKTIKVHGAMTGSKAAENVLKAKAHLERGALMSGFDKMDVAIKEKLVKLFNITYFISKEERVFTIFSKMVVLHQHQCHMFIPAIDPCFIDWEVDTEWGLCLQLI